MIRSYTQQDIEKKIKYAIKDEKNNIIMLWTPRAGCTVSCNMMFSHMGLISETISQADIHHYRTNEFYEKFGFVTLNDLNNHFVFKIIVNPYQIAVSCYVIYSLEYPTHSFYQFLQTINTKTPNQLPPLIASHIQQQYIKGEENYVNVYIKLENGQKEIDEKINQPLGLNLSIEKIKSDHHITRIETDKFFGYLPRNCIDFFPKSYRNFYDTKIKALVDAIYCDDIIHYGYSFDNKF